METVAQQHILTKCSKCNAFRIISDLVHAFVNFNALKINLQILEKIIQKDRGLMLTQGNLLVVQYMYAR